MKQWEKAVIASGATVLFISQFLIIAFLQTVFFNMLIKSPDTLEKKLLFGFVLIATFLAFSLPQSFLDSMSARYRLLQAASYNIALKLLCFLTLYAIIWVYNLEPRQNPKVGLMSALIIVGLFVGYEILLKKKLVRLFTTQ